MYIVKIQTKVTKNDKNANNKVIRTRILKQRHFREFKTRTDAIDYIAEFEAQHPHTNKYGNTTEITGAIVYRQVDELAIEFYKEVTKDEPIGDYIPELEEIAYQREQNSKEVS